MSTIVLGIALCVLDGTIVNLALPGIARDLHASASSVVWVVNAYQVGVLALLLPLAMLGDLIGYRKVYLTGVTLFTLASVACAMSRSLPMLAAARAVQGMGAAGLFGVNSALVRVIYPRRLLGQGVALNSMVVAIASVAGPSVSAAILSAASWPWLFAVNLPLGAMVVFVGWRTLPRNPTPHAGMRLPWLDVALNAAMFGMLFLGADRLVSRDASGTSGVPAAIGLLVGAVAVGAVYLNRQRRQALPLFPVDLLRIPVFRLSMCTSVLSFAAQMLASIALPFLLLDGLHRSPAEAGLVLTAWPLTTVVFAAVAGHLIGRIPDGLLAGIGLVTLACGLLLLAFVPPEPTLLAIAWRLAVCGAGFGLFQSPNNHTIVTSSPSERAGGASGMLGTARLTGQSIGAVMIALLFGLSLPHGGHAFAWALALAACCAAGGSAFSLMRLRP